MDIIKAQNYNSSGSHDAQFKFWEVYYFHPLELIVQSPPTHCPSSIDVVICSIVNHMDSN